MKPTVGSIVHFYAEAEYLQAHGMGRGPYAAIVSRVRGDLIVDLTVMLPIYEMHLSNVIRREHAPEDTVACWTWPPRH